LVGLLDDELASNLDGGVVRLPLVRLIGGDTVEVDARLARREHFGSTLHLGPQHLYRLGLGDDEVRTTRRGHVSGKLAEQAIVVEDDQMVLRACLHAGKLEGGEVRQDCWREDLAQGGSFRAMRVGFLFLLVVNCL